MPKHRKREQPETSPWRRLHVDVRGAAADAISGLLVTLGALGLETEDDETRAVPGRAAVLTGRSLITATFSRAPGLEARVVGKVMALAAELHADASIEWSDLWAEDWNAIFRQHWKPFRCGTRVWVCPSWERDHFHAERVGEGEQPIVLYLDAGMAFGTGTHETTQLCIEAMEAHKPRSLLDIGTGTGILSIAALKLGAGRAVGTDIDPVAVSAARENADNNGVSKQFHALLPEPDDGAAYPAV
ncbi:MAG TPA: 50S ribosomal protein L11 methyltransferase, partial [Myxococcota bacterium]